MQKNLPTINDQKEISIQSNSKENFGPFKTPYDENINFILDENTNSKTFHQKETEIEHRNR